MVVENLPSLRSGKDGRISRIEIESFRDRERRMIKLTRRPALHGDPRNDVTVAGLPKRRRSPSGRGWLRLACSRQLALRALRGRGPHSDA